MPDLDGQTTADAEELPSTPLHAYKEERTEDVKGDAEKLESNEPQDQQAQELEDGGGPPQKH